MNAPEKIPSLRSEIAQHLADVGEATAKQLTEALIQDRLAVTHALHDMVKDAEVEREKKRGNEYVYWLSAVGVAPKKPAEPAPLTEAQREEFTLLGVIADIRAAIGDKEGRIMLGELAEHIKGRVAELNQQLSSIATTAADYLPDPSDITTVRAVEIMDMLIDAQRGQVKVVADLRARVDEQD